MDAFSYMNYKYWLLESMCQAHARYYNSEKKIDIRNEINRVSFEGLIGKEQVDEEYVACYYTYYYLCRIHGIPAEGSKKELDQAILFLAEGVKKHPGERNERIEEDLEELQFIRKNLEGKPIRESWVFRKK